MNPWIARETPFSSLILIVVSLSACGGDFLDSTRTVTDLRTANDLVATRTGELLAATDHGVYRLDVGSDEWTGTGLTEEVATFVEADDATYGTTVSGEIVVSSDGFRTHREISPPGDATTLALVDRDLFVGTERGVYRRIGGEGSWEIAELDMEGGSIAYLGSAEATLYAMERDNGRSRR